MSRTHLPFRAVNCRGQLHYDPGLQRHHLLPRQLLIRPSFARMFDAVGGQRQRLDDFRENGLLLPCREPAALRLGLPLHRGPHRRYSAVVIERVGQIEATWSRARLGDTEGAAIHVHMRLALLQRALRRSLLDNGRRRIVLNRRDPLGTGIDFSDLDAAADALWGATTPVQADGLPVRPVSSRLAA